MAETPNPKHLDKRTTERYLRSGELDEKTYESHIADLPDVADKAVSIETLMGDEVDDLEEDDDELEDEGDEGEDEDSDSAE